MELGHMRTPAVIFCTTDPPNVDPNQTIVHHSYDANSKTHYIPRILNFYTVLKVMIVYLTFDKIIEGFIFDYFRECAKSWRVSQ